MLNPSMTGRPLARGPVYVSTGKSSHAELLSSSLNPCLLERSQSAVAADAILQLVAMMHLAAYHPNKLG